MKNSVITNTKMGGTVAGGAVIIDTRKGSDELFGSSWYG
jgi:hypothetical protein